MHPFWPDFCQCFICWFTNSYYFAQTGKQHSCHCGKKGGELADLWRKETLTSERFFSVDIYLPVVLLPQAPSLKNKWHRSPCNPYNHLIFYKVMRTAVIISKEETVYYTPNHVTKKYLLSEILTPSSSGFFFDIKITQCQGWIKMT